MLKWDLFCCLFVCLFCDGRKKKCVFFFIKHTSSSQINVVWCVFFKCDFLSARLSADLWETEETINTVKRTRPPSRSLCPNQPRPPSSSPSKASSLTKRPNRSFVHQLQGQQAGTSDSPPPEMRKTPVLNKLSSPGQRNSSLFSSCATDKIKVEIQKQSSSSAETSRTLSGSGRFQTNNAGGPAAHLGHLSSDRRPWKKWDLFPQGTEYENSRLASRSRSIGGLSQQCSTGSPSSNSNDRSMPATEKSKTHSMIVPVGTL